MMPEDIRDLNPTKKKKKNKKKRVLTDARSKIAAKP
jgi:hypothetical protein